MILLALLAPPLAVAQDAEPTPEPASVRVDEEGVRLTSPDGQRSFEIHLLAQLLATATRSGDAWSGAASLRRARPFFRYNDDQHRFFVILHAELGRGQPVSLLDGRLDWAASDTVAFAAGHMIVPYSRAWNTPLPLVVQGDRSAINSSLAPGRRTGGYTYLQADERRVEAWLGLYDPVVDRSTLAPMALARVQLNPLGGLPHDELTLLDGDAPSRLAIGVAGLVEPTDDPDNDFMFSALADVSVVGGPARLDVELALRDEGASTSVGGSVLGALTLVPDRVIVGARGTVLERPDPLPSAWIGEAFLTGYGLGPHLLAQLRYTLTAPEDDDLVHQLGVHTQAWF